MSLFYTITHLSFHVYSLKAAYMHVSREPLVCTHVIAARQLSCKCS